MDESVVTVDAGETVARWTETLVLLSPQPETQHLSQEVGFQHDARGRLGRFTGGGVLSGGFSV